MGQDSLPALAAYHADRAAERERHPLAAQLALQGPGHRAVIDVSGVRRVQRGAAPALRLDVGDLARLHPAQPGDAVGLAARLELRQPRQLIITYGDDQLHWLRW